MHSIVFRIGSVFFIFACLSLSGFAGGSLGWDRVIEEISKDDPFLAVYIKEHFDVSPVGIGNRVGHGPDGKSTVEGVEVGTRLPPYEFYAKPKGSKGDYTLNVTFDPLSSRDGKSTLWQMTLRRKQKGD